MSMIELYLNGLELCKTTTNGIKIVVLDAVFSMLYQRKSCHKFKILYFMCK